MKKTLPSVTRAGSNIFADLGLPEADEHMLKARVVMFIGKMVEGRLRKYYEDVVLLEQTYVIDGESRMRAVLQKAAKDLGHPVRVAGFVRYALGEGIERSKSDFAAEVAAQLGG